MKIGPWIEFVPVLVIALLFGTYTFVAVSNVGGLIDFNSTTQRITSLDLFVDGLVARSIFPLESPRTLQFSTRKDHTRISSTINFTALQQSSHFSDNSTYSSSEIVQAGKGVG